MPEQKKLCETPKVSQCGDSTHSSLQDKEWLPALTRQTQRQSHYSQCSPPPSPHILDAVRVGFVFHDGVGGQVQHSPERVPYPGRGRLVAGRLVPYGDDVLLQGKCREVSKRGSPTPQDGKAGPATPRTRLTWKRTETTAPQISSPTMNCSPSIAKMRFSQHRDAKPFRRRMIHLPPFLLASSWEDEKEENEANFLTAPNQGGLFLPQLPLRKQSLQSFRL